MIQRIQSLFLLLTTILAGLFPAGIIMKFSDGMNELALRFAGLSRATGDGYELIEKTIPFQALVVVIPLLSFIIIFLFRNRKLQMLLTTVLIVLIVCLLIAMAHLVLLMKNDYNAALQPTLKLVLPVLMLISAIIARRYIKKDEELVRSYDRLR